MPRCAVSQQMNPELKTTVPAFNSPDLGYHWVWTWGHLIPAALFATAALAVALAGAPWWAWLPLALIATWAFAGFLVMRFGVRMNQIANLPDATFLARDTGRVLDIGCGSGRMSISIARARPAATVVALDNFSATYIRAHGPANTEQNFRLAGVASRATVRSGDMRQMPFEDHSFDAAASSAAIDHLQPDDIRQTLSEVRRVLVPGGQFLLLVVVPNVWLTIAYGPLIWRMRGRAFWREALAEAGFAVEREGFARTSALFLARNKQG